jgi:uncharacterized protein (TIGR03435 family)
MKKMILWIIAFLTLSGSALFAQDITGAWQGTLTPPNGKDLRIVMTISKDDGKLRAVMNSIDQGGQPFKASSVTFADSTLKVELIIGNYEGKLSPDGKSIAGSWIQGSPLPLNLVRATKETAWEIPAPPAPPKLMAADANPAFDVATIKPNNSGGPSMQGLFVRGRNFTIRNGSLGDLIAFAYNVQMKQIIGGPDWADKDRYDIDGVPDQEGVPNDKQLRSMMRKLLTDRFKLTFHHDKRELSAFVLTVGKDGQKLTPTQLNGPLPGFGMRPGSGGVTMNVINSTMEDFTSFMQMLVLDRPVVDQTAITGRYDFKFTFTPDDSQFNGHPPKLPPQTDSTETAPDLFQALQAQTGLKLEAKKTPVDVIVIDKVEKPSAN